MPNLEYIEKWVDNPEEQPPSFKGSTWETSKDLIPYIKYFEGDERDRFLKLSQQQQTRELLLQNVEALLWVGGEKILKGVTEPLKAAGSRFVSPVFKKVFPKAAESLSNIGKTIPAENKSLSKYAGSVNLERQAIPRELKLAELRASEGLPKKKVTWAQIDVKSSEIMKDPKKLGKVLEKGRQTPGELNQVEQDVYRKAHLEGLYQFQNKIQSASTPEEAQAIKNYYTDNLLKPASDVAGEAGRQLQSYNKVIGLTRLGKAVSKLNRGFNERELKEFKGLDLEDATAVKRFADNLGDPKLRDYMYEFWYNSILSGVPTHVVNVASNTGWRMFQIGHRGLTGAIDALVSKLPGRERQRYISEMVPMWGGFAKGKGKAARSAWQTARYGRLQEFETKWAKEMGSTLGAFDRSSSKIVRGAGKVITIPTKALRAMDVYANSLAYDGQMAALARRTAIKNKVPLKARKAFEANFKLKPPDWAHKEAMEFAKYTTFMSDPGKFSRWIIQGRDAIPGGRFLIPFVNTIGNLMKRGVEMTPGVGLVLARGQQPSEVIAKQIEGAIIAGLMYYKAEQGEITGAAPIAKSEREAFYREGKKAWAFKYNDKYWIQYRRVEPFNTVLASTAIFHQRIKEALAAGDEDTAGKHMWDMVNDFKNNLIDSSYLQGVTNILNRYGGAQELPQRMASSMVPFSGFWRSINRAYEAHEEGSAKVYGHKDWLDSFAQVIPGLYKLRTPEINVWGEDVVLPGNVFAQWLPYKFSKQSDDKTEEFLQKLELYPGLPRQRVSHNGIEFKLDDDIYRQMVVDGGSKLKSWMDKKVTLPKWDRLLKTEKGKKALENRIGAKRNYYFGAARKRAIKEQLKRGTLQE